MKTKNDVHISFIYGFKSSREFECPALVDEIGLTASSLISFEIDFINPVIAVFLNCLRKIRLHGVFRNAEGNFTPIKGQNTPVLWNRLVRKSSVP